MSEEEAKYRALEYAITMGYWTEGVVIRNYFQPSNSPLNFNNQPDDVWVVIIEIPTLHGMTPNSYLLEVNCRTGTVSSP